MKNAGTLLLLWTTTLFTLCAQNPIPDYKNYDLTFEQRAKDIVSRMTLEEKISQIGDVSDGIPRLGIQPYNWWNESLHGVARAGTATVFPQAIGMAASFDLDLMSEVANAISDEARAKHHEALRNQDYGRYKGLTFWSPNINIFRDPRWGRGHETYGEDPFLTGQMGMRFVKGLQGNDSKYLKLVATAKHFAVHNGPEPERHFFNVVPDKRDLWETYLPAFEDLMVDAKAYSIMGAYNRVDGASASASWMLLEDILRKQWGFEGYVVSDCGAIRDIYMYHKIVNTAEEAAAVGLRRGCDLNCGNVYKKHMLEAVQQGLIAEGEIDRAVYRLMMARMKLGMFDPIEMVSYAQIPYEVNDSKPHDELAMEMAKKSMTLLKNDGILPLNAEKLKSLAVIGPNAQSLEVLRANYYGDATNPVSIYEGINQKVGGITKVIYHQGCPIVDYVDPSEEYSTVPSQYLTCLNEQGNKENGLYARYFNGKELNGKPVIKRVDPELDFKWKTSSPTATLVAQGILTPEEALGNDNFSVEWNGTITPPESGTYSLGAISDDGCRIYLDGELIVNEWTDHAAELYASKVYLAAGKEYNLKIEYYESIGGASFRFVWQLPASVRHANTEWMPSEKMLEDVKNADVAVFVGGLDATWEGEQMGNRNDIDGFNGGDRTKIELPEVQMKTLEAMIKTGTPVIFVMAAGSAIAFEGLEQDLEAMLLCWYPGQRGGDAVANVLFGDYNPAGRLPVTFYKSTDELADFRDYNMQAGKGFTYRYYSGDPLFPFGHGLSYTSFEYTDLTIDKKNVCTEDSIIVHVKVRNSGKLAGEEVVQLYVHDRASDIVMPVKQLRGFERISLKTGEEKAVTFTLHVKEDFRYFNAFYDKYLVDPGEFEIQVGASSEDIRVTQIIRVE